VKFDGFLRVYFESHDDEDDDTLNTLLPPVKVGQILQLDEMTATQRFSKPPARYTEASLVKKMEEVGIGRPSTYAPTISKIMEENRGYVVKETREGTPRPYKVLRLKNEDISLSEMTEMTGAAKNQLFPTDMGMVVTDFLIEHFSEIMDYHFTAEIEKEFDEIAEGSMEWNVMIAEFYKPFHLSVENTKDTASRATGERILGTDPGTGHTIFARMTRLGKPVIQIGKQDELAEDEKPRFANLKPGQSMETIELGEAMLLFTLPKELGLLDGVMISINTGRYGPYVKYGDAFISLPKGEDPYNVDLSRAVEIIRQKQKADAPVASYEGKPVTKGTGRFGPFIKWNEMYINVPRRFNLDELTQENINELISTKVDKEANRFVRVFDDGIAIENGRWGPFIRYGKKMFKITKNKEGQKYTTEDLVNIPLADIRAMIEEQEPGIFDKKIKGVAAKKPAGAKSAVKKPAAKKAAPRKAAPKK